MRMQMMLSLASSFMVPMYVPQMRCILHNMLLQYDGLDTIGDHDDDYLEYEGEHSSTSESDTNSNESGDLDDEPTEIQVGYAERRSRLWVHYKSALEKGCMR